MKVMAKTWDFIFGVVLIAGAPLLVFWVAGNLVRHVYYNYPPPDRGPLLWMYLVFALSTGCATPALSLWFICRWRKTHRLLPISFFSFEATLGVAAALLYLIMQMGLGLK